MINENMNKMGIAGMLRRMADSGYYNTTEFEGINVTEILKCASDEIICLKKGYDTETVKFREEVAKNTDMKEMMKEMMKEVGIIKASTDCKYYMPSGICERRNAACTRE